MIQNAPAAITAAAEIHIDLYEGGVNPLFIFFEITICINGAFNMLLRHEADFAAVFMRGI